MFLRRAGYLGLLVTCFALVLPADAFAYLDPGTGSMVFQLAAAAIMGALFTVKLYWRRVKGRVKGMFGKSADDAHDAR
jgi:hypothetical protein